MYQVKINGQDPVTAQLDSMGGVSYGDTNSKMDISRIAERDYHIIREGKNHRVQLISADAATKTYTIRVGSNRYKIELADKYDLLLKQLGMDASSHAKVNDVKAPMPGMVVEVLVKVGQDIKKGDPVVILEAMKMENILKAVSDATVKSVSVQKGTKVEKNETLVALK